MQPYRTTPVFTEDTLPAALRKRHDTKSGVWGIIRMLEGQIRLTYLEPHAEQILTPQNPGFIAPQQLHFVQPMGPMRMIVEFYDADPAPRPD